MKQPISKFIKFIIGWPLSVIAIIFFTRYIFTQTSHISFSTFSPNLWLVMLSIVVFVVYFILRGIFWQQLLKARGHITSLQETMFLWSQSELQRYIPGNIWSVVKRSVSFEKKGIDKKTTAALWVYEAQFLCMGALIVSLLSLDFIVYGILPQTSLQHLLVLLLTVVIYAGVAFFLFHQKFTHRFALIRHLLPPFSPTTTLKLLFFMVAAFWCFGIATYFSIAAFTPLYPHDFNTFVGFFVFAFLVGYLSFIFPMGLGPREGIMTYGLSRYIVLPLAGIGALFSRLLLICAELLFLLSTYVWYRIPKYRLQMAAMFLQKHKYFLITLLFVGIYIMYFTTASFMRYDNFFTGRFDLGNMDQTVWNTLHGRIFQLTDPDGTNIISRLSVHADFVLIFLAPFYLLWQDPRMLLLLQTVILAGGAIFIYLLGEKITTKKPVAMIFAILYLINPAVEYTNLYDFHGVTLATTFFLGAFYFLKKRQTFLMLLFLFLGGTTKEEAWVIVALFGLYAFFVEKQKTIGITIFLAGSALFYSIFFKAIPLARGGQHFAVAFYSDFGNSPAEIIKTMIFSPQKTIATIIQKNKLIYLFELLFPIGFLPLLSPFVLLFSLPDFAVNLLSSSSPFHEIYYQYTAIITAFIFIAALYSFDKIQKKLPYLSTPALLGVVLCTGIIAASNYGPLPISKKANVDMFWLQQSNKELINNFLNSIPRRYSIAATNNLGSHLSHRQLIYTIPNGLDKADILVFLLNDIYAQPSLSAQIQMTERLRRDKNYVEAIHIGNFVVFEKKNIYPHMRVSPRPNSLIPVLLHTLHITPSEASEQKST